jgi:VanZ family protein
MMARYPRQKAVLLALLIYWPAMCVATHLPQMSRWVAPAHVSDKTAHFIVYLALVFLWWHSVSPGRKVRWQTSALWLTLLVVVSYGAIDEWLQKFVGRDADLGDFLANVAGVVTGLVLVSLLSFWPGLVAVSAVIIFAASNLSRINLARLIPTAYVTLHLLAYGLFTLVWARYLEHLEPQAAGAKTTRTWRVVITPAGLLLAVKMFSYLLGRGCGPADVTAAAAGIAIAAAACRVIPGCRCSRRRQAQSALRAALANGVYKGSPTSSNCQELKGFVR